MLISELISALISIFHWSRSEGACTNKSRNHRVASVSHGTVGTKRECLISKGFIQYIMRHEFFETNNLSH